jgi:hypothetical protein
MKKYTNILIQSMLISIIGVYVIDYISHLLFSNPMETMPYFMTKLAMYFVFSILFLYFVQQNKHEWMKVAVAGISVSLLWGFYYNILPFVIYKFFGIYFYPFGIALIGLTFLGMGIFGTGLAFGIVHTLAFIGGYYLSKFAMEKTKIFF